MTMSEGFSQSKYRTVAFCDLFLGGRESAERLVSVGPVPPATRDSLNEEGIGERKQFGSKALRGEGAPRVAMIGFGNIRRDGTISFPDEPTLPYGPKVHDYVVRPGDILFRNRGYVGTEKVSVAAYVDREDLDLALRALKSPANEGCFVFNSSLFRIRLQDGVNDAPLVDAEYLAAYINSSQAQRYLTKHNQGMVITGIKKKDLLDLPIALPSLSEQKQLVQLIRAQAEYARVSARLSECYGLLANHAFNRS
jgi:hypothetical protein